MDEESRRVGEGKEVLFVTSIVIREGVSQTTIAVDGQRVVESLVSLTRARGRSLKHSCMARTDMFSAISGGNKAFARRMRGLTITVRMPRISHGPTHSVSIR